jgi:ribosomal protein S18 acetylase RimI-like enzyme
VTAGFRDELLTVWEMFTASLPGARLERGAGYVLVSYPRFPSAAMNAVWSWGGGGTAVADLASRLAEIEGTGVSPGVMVSDREAPELEDEARRLGLTERHEIPGMVATASTFRPADSAGLDVVVAHEREQCEQALDVAAAGFGFPREWAEELYSPAILELEGTSLYLGLAAGRPVTTALAVRSERSVGIFNVATPPEERGRGYAAEVTSRAAADGFDAGVQTAWLQASGMGFGIYRRLGFETVSTAELWVRPDADTTGV